MARGGGPPPLKFYGPKALNRQANRQVRQTIKASSAPIKTAQALADARAVAAQKSLAGFGLAAAGILKDSAGQIPQGYKDAAEAESGMAAGFSQQAGDQVRAQVASSQATIDRLAPGGAVTDPNAPGMQDALYGQTGYIPGASNEEQAAAANRFGLEQPAIQAQATSEAVQQSIADQTANDQQYTQQMLDLAAKTPELRTQIMQQLQQNELAKRSAYIQQQAQTMVNRRFNVTARQAQQRINISRSLGLANLRLAQSRDRQALRQAMINGRRIDSSASHAAGHLIDQSGHPILGKNGKPIPVHESGTGAGGAYGVGSSKYGQAVRSVDSLMPKPTPNPQYDALITDPTQQFAYKYRARPGKGHLIPGSGWFTSKASEAATTPTRAGVATFQDGVKFLMNSYGLSRPAARKALRAGGWKPDGKRPKK